MPELKEYVNREGLTPTDRGTEARVQEGRRVGAFFNQQAESLRDFGNRTANEIGGAIRDAGNVAVDYMQHREISQGIATYAQMQDNLTNQWNDIAKNADPNDPAVAQKFREEVLSPKLQEWGSTFNTEGGQKWAQQRTAALLDHMYEKTAADMGTLAAQAVSNNLRTVGNTMSNTAMNDPSSVPHLVESVKSSVGALVDSSPNLKGAPAGKAKTEITEKTIEAVVKAGAIGAIQKSRDPEATADEWVRKYPQYINGEEARILAANARQQIRASRADDAYARTIDRQERQDRSDQAESQILPKIFSDDPRQQRQVTAKSIVNNPDLTNEKKLLLTRLIERETKPETNNRVSAATTVDLLRKLRDPNADADKVMNDAWEARLKDPGLNGSLTERDFNAVRNEIIGRKTPDGAALGKDRDEFFKKFSSSIDIGKNSNVLGSTSALGQQRIYQAEQDARRQEEVLRKAGKDPHEVYDARSPNFFGRPENLKKYQPTLTEINAYEAKLKGDQPKGKVAPADAPVLAPFEPFVKPAEATFNQRFQFDPAATPQQLQPPVEGARRSPNDGQWYVQKGGKFFRVNQ